MSLRIELKVNGKAQVLAKLTELGKIPKDVIMKEILRMAYAVERDAKAAAPVRTGRGRSSITVGQSPEGNPTVGTNLKYMSYIEFGTKPHEIIGKPVLSWLVGGRRFWSKMVHHPGTLPRPFLQPAFEKHSVRFRLRIEQLVQQFVKT